jgi:regulator of protease activity HflC (stomatin/prohibitin superfamily)
MGVKSDLQRLWNWLRGYSIYESKDKGGVPSAAGGNLMGAKKNKPFMESIRDWFKRYSIYLSIIVLIVIFFVLLLSNRIFYSIHSGERGVRFARFGGGTVLDRVYPEGMRAIPPWDQMFIYNVRVQEVHDSIVVLSSNGLPMTVSYSCRYHADANKIAYLHQRFGPDYLDVLIKPEIVGALRAVLGNYRPDEIYSRDEEGLQNEVYSVLEANITDHFVVLHDVLIKELRLTPELESAINQKLVMEQNALSYEFRLKTEESEKTRKGIEAQGIKNFEDISGVSMLKWRGILATEELAKSPNSKIIVIGTGPNGLPVILNTNQ